MLAVLIKKFWFVLILPFVWLFNRLRGKGKNKQQEDPVEEANQADGADHSSHPSDPQQEADEDSRFKSKFELKRKIKAANLPLGGIKKPRIAASMMPLRSEVLALL